MLKLKSNSKGLIEMFELIQKPAEFCNTYRIPKIHTIEAGEYDISDAEKLFPSSLFECIQCTTVIFLNFIDADTGRVTGVIGQQHLYGESIGETIFKAAEKCHITNISGIIVRYNNHTERKFIKYIPFAVIEK